MIMMKDVKENKVLSVSIDMFNFEYDDSIPCIFRAFKKIFLGRYPKTGIREGVCNFFPKMGSLMLTVI